MEDRFGVVTLAAMAGERPVDDPAPEYTRALASLGGERWDVGRINDPAPLVVLVATGGTERSILDVWRRRFDTAARVPVLLVAHPGGNSLGACLEALARLRQDGFKGRILYLKGPEDHEGLGRVTDAVYDVRVRSQLRESRIGLVGTPSGWLVASSPDPAVVRSTWGPHVLPVSLERLTEAIRSAPGETAQTLRDSVVAGAAEVVEPSDGDIDAAVHVSTAVRGLAESLELSGVALRCFDLIGDFGTTGCLALSDLSDSGLAAGCEGDVVSTVAMLWARTLLGESAWMANPSRIDTAANRLTLAHCTVPRSMVGRYGLRSHYESGKGLAIQGTFAEGRVTLVRIGGPDMKQLWLEEANLLRSTSEENLCRTQVELELSTGGACADLLDRPLGNHVVMIPGAHRDRLRSWWELIIAD